MREVFGFDMNVKNDALPTSPYAVLDLGEGNVLLMSNVDVEYGTGTLWNRKTETEKKCCRAGR